MRGSNVRRPIWHSAKCVLLRRHLTHASRIRNIGVVAHIDAGKTTVTEQILVQTGSISTAGNIRHGNTTTDYLECEQNRGITVNSAFVRCHWQDHLLNIIDTPGHIDFNFEVERSLRALDGALVVLDGTRGVEAQTLTVWKQLSKFSIPSIIFLNKMDREKRNISTCLSSIREVLDAAPVLLTYPVFSEDSTLVGVTESPTTPSEQELRTEAVETLASLDEKLEDVYFARDCRAEDVPQQDIWRSAERLHRSGKIVPVCLGSGLKAVGVDTCLDHILRFLPSPLQRSIPHELKNQVCGVIFKSSLDRQRGVLCQTRLYSGSLKPGSRLFNIRTKTIGKVSSIYHLEAGTLVPQSDCQMGHIGVFTGCKDFRTGDIIVDASWKSNQSHLAEIISSNRTLRSTVSHSEPLFFCTVECSSGLEQERLEQALYFMTFEDPTLVLRKGRSEELLLGGTGQLHLSVARERLKQEHGIECKAYQLRVNYLETVASKFIYSHESSTGSRVNVTLSPRAENISNRVDVKVGSDTKVIDMVERTVNSCLAIGPLIGSPIVHTEISVTVEGLLASDHDRKLAQAVRTAVRDALSQAGVVLCEPFADVVVEGPMACNGAIVSDFMCRIGSSEYEVEYGAGGVFTMRGNAPLSQAMDYVAVVRSLSRGLAAVQKIEMTRYCAMEPEASENLVKLFKSGQLSM